MRLHFKFSMQIKKDEQIWRKELNEQTCVFNVDKNWVMWVGYVLLVSVDISNVQLFIRTELLACLPFSRRIPVNLDEVNSRGWKRDWDPLGLLITGQVKQETLNPPPPQPCEKKPQPMQESHLWQLIWQRRSDHLWCDSKDRPSHRHLDLPHAQLQIFNSFRGHVS